LLCTWVSEPWMAAYWLTTEAKARVWTTCPELLPGSRAAGNRTPIMIIITWLVSSMYNDSPGCGEVSLHNYAIANQYSLQSMVKKFLMSQTRVINKVTFRPTLCVWINLCWSSYSHRPNTVPESNSVNRLDKLLNVTVNNKPTAIDADFLAAMSANASRQTAQWEHHDLKIHI